jgi:DNA polymerase elongation subunit (family B)
MNYYTNVFLAGNTIYCKEIDEHGNKKLLKEQFSPSLYIISKTPTSMKTLDGRFVERIPFSTIKEAREFVRNYSEVSNFELFGQTMWQYQYISDNYPNDIEFDLSKIKILNFDIEVDSENGFPVVEKAENEIITITTKNFTDNHYNFFYFKDGFDEVGWRKKFPERDVIFFRFENERDMLSHFLSMWYKSDPDVITGWSISFFDIPYLINRLKNLFGEQQAKRISPFKMISKKTEDWFGKEKETYEIAGIAILDYINIYKKYVKDPRESYKLDYVSQVELGEGKRKYIGSLQNLYNTDFDSFVEYNIKDVELVERLEKKMKLIELTINVAYESKVNYEDVESQVRTWDVKLYNSLRKEKIVIPFKKEHEKNDAYVGAYVKEPKPGLYKWVVSFDVTSLYPSIIRVLNIGVETKVEKTNSFTIHDALSGNSNWLKELGKAKKNNQTLSLNGVFYDRDRISFYSKAIETMFNDRLKYKKLAKEAKDKLEHCHDKKEKETLKNDVSKYDLKQKAVKVSMNSLYGAVGSNYFRFYDIDNAEAVTITGQFIIQIIERELNAFLNKIFKTKDFEYVIYCDTDSVYIRMETIVDLLFKNTDDTIKIINFLDEICKKELQPKIDEICSNISFNMLNGMGDLIKMIRDVLADKSIWTAKKRYMMNVYDSEGIRYEKPKLKMMGIEAIKASTPKSCREKIKEAISIILTKDNDALLDLIESFEKEFYTLDPEDIAFPRGVNGIDKYTDEQGKAKKGAPYHVRGAINFNYLIKLYGLEKTIPSIQEGEKIKFLAMREPNAFQDKVISFVDYIPKEFGIDKTMIDFETQFEKSFLDPLRIIVKAIGWKMERVVDMSEFFIKE